MRVLIDVKCSVLVSVDSVISGKKWRENEPIHRDLAANALRAVTV